MKRIVVKRTEKDFRDYLESINLDTLRKRIKKFKKEDFTRYNEEKMIDEFWKTLNFGKNFIFPPGDIVSKNDFIYFRCRPIKDSPFLNETEYWGNQNPKDIGRLNRIGEGVLYTGTDSIIAIKEASIKYGERFSLACFEETESINAVWLDLPKHKNFDTYAIPEKNKLATIYAFIRWIIRYKRHELSSAIAHELIDYNEIDAIAYSSIHGKYQQQINVCFTTYMPKKLDLKMVLMCQLVKKNGERDVIFDSAMSPNGDTMIFHSIKSIEFTEYNKHIEKYLSALSLIKTRRITDIF